MRSPHQDKSTDRKRPPAFSSVMPLPYLRRCGERRSSCVTRNQRQHPETSTYLRRNELLRQNCPHPDVRQPSFLAILNLARERGTRSVDEDGESSLECMDRDQ